MQSLVLMMTLAHNHSNMQSLVLMIVFTSFMVSKSAQCTIWTIVSPKSRSRASKLDVKLTACAGSNGGKTIPTNMGGRFTDPFRLLTIFPIEKTKSKQKQ